MSTVSLSPTTARPTRQLSPGRHLGRRSPGHTEHGRSLKATLTKRRLGCRGSLSRQPAASRLRQLLATLRDQYLQELRKAHLRPPLTILSRDTATLHGDVSSVDFLLPSLSPGSLSQIRGDIYEDRFDSHDIFVSFIFCYMFPNNCSTSPV
jgi:hypothetical protein